MTSSRTDALDALRTVLEGIDGTGSYNNSLTVVQEIPEVPDSGKLPYASLHRGEERYSDAGGALTSRLLDFIIEGWVLFSPPGTNAADAADDLLEDIDRVIATDRSLGDSVVDVKLTKNQTFTSGAGDNIAVVVVEGTINYRHIHGTP